MVLTRNLHHDQYETPAGIVGRFCDLDGRWSCAIFGSPLHRVFRRLMPAPAVGASIVGKIIAPYSQVTIASTTKATFL